MNDPLLVRGFEGLGDLLRDRQRSSSGMAPRAMRCDEIVALDEFHHERGESAALFEAVDARDVGMVERREDFGFALKARQRSASPATDAGRTLIATWRFRLRVGGPIDLAHPAHADLRGDFVGAEAGAGSQGQVAGL